MLQGTGSDAGKSLIAAGLCRAFVRRGLAVAPFKPQNMSNNAAVTVEGGEIGRAQALQARACGLAASVDMNPVLLKPQSEIGAQVVVQGRVAGTARARDYAAMKATLMPKVLGSFARLGAGRDLVVVEGAGSAAEINLRAGDIANMGFATAAGVPVVLVADIDRGGVIASLAGICAVLPAEERALIAGYLVNKFRGDPRLFDSGIEAIARHTGLASFGVVPWFADAARLPAEDAASLDGQAACRGRAAGARLRIAVPRLPRIANFDDIDPLAAEPDVEVIMVAPGSPLPGDADVVLLPGSKATIADLAALRREGWDIDIAAHHRRGGAVVGLCGGYQMLGRRIADPDGIEGPPGEAEGLGLLAVETVLGGSKTLLAVRGTSGVGGGERAAFAGYEMHMGRTTALGPVRPWLHIDGTRPEGALSPDGRVMGSYVHGLFAADAFRRTFIAGLGARSVLAYDAMVETVLDALADHLEAHADLDAMLAAARA